MKGLIIGDDNKIALVLDGVLELNEKDKIITYKDGQLGGIDFDNLNIIVTDLEQEFNIGDEPPSNIIDLSQTIKAKDELINSLGQELIRIKFEIMALKGGGL